MKLISPHRLALVFIIAIGLLLRLNGVNWDDNHHLHPDERFLTMVGVALEPEDSFSDYLSADVSTMNPANVGFQFYVYGTVPLTINTYLAEYFNTKTYNLYTLQGRVLSAFFDILTLIFVYKIAKLLLTKKNEILNHPPAGGQDDGRRMALWSAFFYAIAVLPIQLSHFFAVDTFLTTFMVGSSYYLLKYALYDNPQTESLVHRFITRIKGNQLTRHRLSWRRGMYVVMGGIFFGLALATKISALYILPLLLMLIIFPLFRQNGHSTILPIQIKSRGLPIRVGMTLISLILFTVIAYVVMRLGDPYYFSTSNFLDFRLNPLFVSNISQLKNFEGPDVWFPPAIQWINTTPVIFPLKNLAIFGVGIPYFILIIIGIITIYNLQFSIFIKNFKFQISNFKTVYKKVIENQELLAISLIIMWCLAFFLYQSTQFVKAMRYFIILYPFLAIVAALGFERLLQLLLRLLRHYLPHNDRILYKVTKLLTILLVLIWPLAFSYIYTKPHSRVEASKWMYQFIPNRSSILIEHWDDGLPLGMVSNKQFIHIEFPVFGEDTDEKWKQMKLLMDQGDYYSLSSNRAWGSIQSVPEKYPVQSQFYKELLNNELEYKKIAEFTSYPSLCVPFTSICLVINDQWADESFTVYDHPKVMIFENTAR